MLNGAFYTYASTENNPHWGLMIARRFPIEKRDKDIRTEFGRDYTRILHSTAYRRLKHKTQVFYSPQNDHICTRIEHVNHVESVSYTIATHLGLNTELTKAIAVGHDLGHAPFGHLGETIIKKILRRENLHMFWHERNGLHFVDDIELLENSKGEMENLNLTYAVRDGIVSHCGEVDENGLKPRTEYIDLSEYQEVNQYKPFTWEGCVVKIADKISYLGRDIEDALALEILTDSEIEELLNWIKKIPEFSNITLKEINNTFLIHEFIINLCQNSSPEKGLCLSPGYFELMKTIKDYNTEYIYQHQRLEAYNDYAELVINKMYAILKSTYDGEQTVHNLKKLEKFYPRLAGDFRSWIEKYWDLTDRSLPEYSRLKNKVIYNISANQTDYLYAIIDYISGMTDQFAIRIFNEIISF